MAAATIINNNKNRIIVDLDVWNCQIRAFKPEIQTRMALSDVEKMLFWNNASLDRLNNRIMGELKGAALRKAKRVIDKHWCTTYVRNLWFNRDRRKGLYSLY